MAPHSPHEAEAAAVARLQRVVEQLRRRMAFIEGSRFWKLRGAYVAFRRMVGRPVDGEPPAAPPRDLAEALDCSDPYARWLLLNEPRPADLDRMRSVTQVLGLVPRIAIVVLPGGSVEPQSYPSCRVLTLAESNEDGIPPADQIAVVGPGETLCAAAASEIVLALNRVPRAEMAYGDHDRIDAKGRRSAPFFAPGWSPDTLLAYSYSGVTFYARDLYERAGGLRKDAGEAAAYDLALRASELTNAIVTCQRMLSHRPLERADAALAAEEAAVLRALERRKLDARIEPIEGLPEARTIRYAIADPALVEVIVPTRDRAADLERALAGVFGSAYPALHVTIVDNGSIEPETLSSFERLQREHGKELQIVRRDEPFNFSRLVNAAAALTQAPYLLLLNNDTQTRTQDWIEAMVEYAQQAEVGAVGARLLYGDGTIQHAGVAIGIGGLAGHPYRGEAVGASPYATGIVRDCKAVTAACLMVRREAFESVGGFDETLAVEFNDIDFCLKLDARGLRNVYLPHVELYHFESSSRGVPESREAIAQREAERRIFASRWKTAENFIDPYYHPALTRLAEDASLAL